jgi:hypothetical protein
VRGRASADVRTAQSSIARWRASERLGRGWIGLAVSYYPDEMTARYPVLGPNAQALILQVAVGVAVFALLIWSLGAGLRYSFALWLRCGAMGSC